MDLTEDELAGVVDLFGGLTRAELSEALAELVYRQGGEYDLSAHADTIDAAIRSYHLVAVANPADREATERDWADEKAHSGKPLLLAGPLAFPTLPSDARDLPHILDVSKRTVDTDDVGHEVAEMFREDARSAIDADDQSRIDTLLDASYEVEPWTGVDLAPVRQDLAAATQTN
ncbi:hypothetical protein ACFQJ7_10610 [Halovenus rubra]|uniref:Uncharacterized protein n=2 Tax=Halovenus rubra TaxID=869890 RepID=A0ACC7DXN2_9EURY|nr:hypothetical protein [Halovenus rubra]